MTELQFWKKALKDFEKPGRSTYSHLGICYYSVMQDDNEWDDRKHHRIWKLCMRELDGIGVDIYYRHNLRYLDEVGMRSEKRIRFIKRMICQCQKRRT